MNADWERIYETFRVFGVIDPDAVLAAANRRRCLCFDSEIRRATGVVGMLHVSVSGCPEHGRRENPPPQVDDLSRTLRSGDL